MDQEDFDRLRLFNEKAERLLNTRFVEYVRKNKRISFRLQFRKGKGIKTSIKLPDQDAIDAFVLTFRYFIQNNEQCSFGNLAKTYSKSYIPKAMGAKYFQERTWLNEYLDDPSSLKPLTRRSVIDIFVYGGLAHANPQKKAKFDKLRKNSVSKGIAKLEFASILLDILEVIKSVAKLNSEVLAKLANG